MSYVLHDANGYLADGPTTRGLELFVAWAGPDPVLVEFLEDGLTTDPAGLAEALDERRATGPVEATRQALADAARRADDVLILTDGLGGDEPRDAAGFDPDQPRDERGQWSAGGGDASSSSSLEDKELQRHVASYIGPVARRMRFPVDRIDVVYREPRTFKLGDETLTEAGHYNPKTGRIEINMRVTQQESLYHVTTHEVAHAQYDRVKAMARDNDFFSLSDLKREQPEEYGRLFFKNGKPRKGQEEEIARRWPATAALASVYGWGRGPGDVAQAGYEMNDNVRALIADDGVSPYSRKWWDEAERALAKSERNWRSNEVESAINETLAEIARIRSKHAEFGDRQPTERWAKFFDRIQSAYEQVHTIEPWKPKHLRTSEWDESVHPRVPAGNPGGGQFTESGSSGLSVAAVKDLADGIAKHMLYNPEWVNVVHEPPRVFAVGDRTFTEAGHFDPMAGIIQLNAATIHDERSVASIAVHEVAHAQWRYWESRRSMETDEISALSPDEFKRLFTVSGKVRPEHEVEVRRRWPINSEMANFWGGPFQFGDTYRSFDDLRKEDGVSEYSRAYWSDEALRENGSTERAVNETLAEISRIQLTGKRRDGDSEPAPTWSKMAQAIRLFYRQQHAYRKDWFDGNEGGLN